ncbi:MAG: MFS transporter [Candidatus Dormibacteraceae bacterium]
MTESEDLLVRRVTVDDAPLNRFHLRMTVFTDGGMFCDGYILGIISIALVLMTPQFHLGTVWQGLIGASALIGIFCGSLIFGLLTDLVGRQKFYTFDLIVFLVASVLQLFIQGAVELFILRVIMGLAIGADYAIGAPLLAEFLPRRHRGTLMASLNCAWTIGYVCAFVFGYAIKGLGPHSWRWMLASSAIPAAFTTLLRIGAPESPRWLLSKGRIDEAEKILKKYIHPDVRVEDLSSEANVGSDYRKLFDPRWRSRTIFAGLFWACQVLPSFVIGTFIPSIVRALGIRDEFTGSLFYNLSLLGGGIAGVIVMNMIARRRLTIGSFAVLSLALLVVGVWPKAPTLVVGACIMVFAFVVSGAGNLETVYPSEIFPTEVRASGVGFAAGTNRVGAAGGTFLLPIVLGNWGVGAALLGCCAVTLVGLAASVAWAPETRGLTLSNAGAGGQRGAPAKVRSELCGAPRFRSSTGRLNTDAPFPARNGGPL